MDVPVFKTNQVMPHELREVAELHRSEVRSGFLSSLGLPVLQTIYSHIARSDHATLILALVHEDGPVCGFISGSADTGRLYREFAMQNCFHLLPRVLPILFSPRTVGKALETLLYPRRPDLANLPRAEILNFVIRQRYRGTGLAEEFFSRLVIYFRSRGITSFKIVTGKQQVAAQRFYARAGAQSRVSLELHRGTQSLVFTYDIPGPEGPVSASIANGKKGL
jgi:GNAT superfamily N-acetyltransferase